jgi:HEPN domain-containing protein
MNRVQLRSLAVEKLEDVKTLLAQGRWAAAYYLCGYVIECSLKACLLRYIGESNVIFGEEKYLKRLMECWTHDLTKLFGLAGLEAEFGIARGANSDLDLAWKTVVKWTETSRYEFRTEQQAQELFTAVSDPRNGVFQWIQPYW